MTALEATSNVILQEMVVERQNLPYRYCRTSIETQLHVFCLCKRNSPLIIGRHYVVMIIITKALLAEKPILKIKMDRECEWLSPN